MAMIWKAYFVELLCVNSTASHSSKPLGFPISITETQELDRGRNCYLSGEELNAACTFLPRRGKKCWLG
ncbi:hypothetical protein BDW66DRAFT_125177 [Aspergillus desertorum]